MQPEETTKQPQRKGVSDGSVTGKRTWVKTPTPNLIRYEPKGTYYLRARVNGKIVRESLRTTTYKIATLKVSERLRELRMSTGRAVDCVPETLTEALAIVERNIPLDTNLSARSREAYKEALSKMKPGKRAAVPNTPLLKLTPEQMKDWWANASTVYRPQSANHLLMFVRKALKLARRTGGIFSDPAEELQPMKIPRTRLNLPTVEQFRAVVAAVRNNRMSYCREESARWIEWMAYSGMRPFEIHALKWQDIDEKEDVVTVLKGKGQKERNIPINPPMRDLLARMQADTPVQSGPVFKMKWPRESLNRACKIVGVPPQRLYNLRHLFATTCRDSGIPVPTFAEWLGHSDGGALAMRTYVQKSSKHGKEAAAKLSF